MTGFTYDGEIQFVRRRAVYIHVLILVMLSVIVDAFRVGLEFGDSYL